MATTDVETGGTAAEKVAGGTVASGSAFAPDAIAEIVERQRAFFATGRTIDVDYRIASLRRLREVVCRREADIEEAVKADLGKSAFESYMCEVGLTLAELSYQLKHVRRWAKPHRVVPSDLANFPSSYRRVPEPYGVALVMSPWNYPFMLTVEPLIGAVAAGNCCVVKPSAYSPATSRIVAEIVAEAFERGHVDAVLGGRAENAELLEMFNAGLANIREDGTYDEIVATYLGE